MNASAPVLEFESLRQSFEAGRCAEAAEALGRLETRDVIDADLHARIAHFAEQAGDLERAIYEYNLCLRDDADHKVALRRLGRLRLDQGDDLRARRAWERLTTLDPTDAETQHALALLDARAGRLPKPVRPHTTDTLAPAGLGEPRRAPAPEPDDWPQVDDDATLTFLSRFAGREGVHARQWAGEPGRQGYSPVNAPFTPAVARQHLLGQSTIGVYPMRLDQTVRFLAFDFDATKGVRDQSALSALSSRPFEAALRLVHAAAVRMVDVAAALGLTGLLEDSGWKGRHVWFFFARPVPASAARQLADVLLARLPALPPEVSVEVFPKQAQLRPDQVGNLIKLPLGVHRVSGRRSLFLHADGTTMADPIEVLRTVPLIDRDTLHGLLSRLPAPTPATARHQGRGMRADEGIDADDSPPWDVPGARPASQPGGVSIGPMRLDVPAYRLDEDVEAQTLLARCAVLRDVVDRARTEGTLTPDERSVVTYTLGHLTHGAAAVNAVLDCIPGHDPIERLKSPLRGHPTSCPKIRGKLKTVAETTGCACAFAAGAAAYPHPLIHVQEARNRGIGAGVTQTVELSTLQAERLVEDLRRLRADLHRLNRLANEAEARLKDFMETQALAALETPSGILHLDREHGTLRLELLTTTGK